MPARPAKKANTGAARKANERALTPEQKAYRKGAREATKLALSAMSCMQEEFHRFAVELALKVASQQRTIARLHEQLGTTRESS